MILHFPKTVKSRGRGVARQTSRPGHVGKVVKSSVPKRKVESMEGPRLSELGKTRAEKLRFLVIQSAQDMNLSNEAFLDRLQTLFQFSERGQLLAYLNCGELGDFHRKVFRDAIVKLWSGMKLHADQKVDWAFVNSKLGQQGYAYLLDLRN